LDFFLPHILSTYKVSGPAHPEAADADGSPAAVARVSGTEKPEAAGAGACRALVETGDRHEDEESAFRPRVTATCVLRPQP
jgi:hypothetical protein